MTQEFHISVTPVGNDEYLVRTEQVEPGVPLAEEQVTWQVEEWLTQARQLMSDPLLGLLQGDRPHSLEAQAGQAALQTSLSLVNLGQHLYSALFQGTLRDSWVTAQGIAQNRREALRLRLGLKGSRLPRLPWEVMYGNDMPAERMQQSFSTAARPLAAGTHVIFSRYQPSQRLSSDRLPQIISTDQPLRILMVIAAPDDQDRLQLHQEARQLQQELLAQSSPNSSAAPDIQLTVLDQPGREQLTQALEQGHYQVLHYAGHSDLSSAGGSLYLVNSRTGLTEILSGDDLAGLLVNNGIRLAVFNSCRGAYTATADPVNERERNLAEALVSRGIPAVLAMAEQIPDNVALTLTWLFYRNLKQDYPIDLSLSRARQGLISAYGSHQLYWALPILYLHPEFDGYLTPRDRTFDNPADRLVLLPQGFGSFPVLTIDENAPLPASFLIDDSQPPTDEEMVANAVLAEDDLGDWIEDLEAFDDTQDEAETLDWIRQLTTQVAEVANFSADSATPEVSSEAEADSRVDAAIIPPDAETTSPLSSSLISAYYVPSASQPEPQSEPVEPGRPATLVHSVDPSRDITIAKPIASASGGSMVQAIPIQGQMSRPPRRNPRRPTPRGVVVPLLGAVGALAVAALSYSVISNLNGNNPNAENSQAQVTPPDAAESFSENLVGSSTAQVQAIALSSFGKQQMAQGQQAVQVLLDRDALSEASVALAAVPKPYQDKPEIRFLQGRLAWQSVKQGDSKYKLTDAQTAWENAAKQEPNSALYHQALGFAYYAEGDALRARQSWMQAISILENGQSPTIAQSALNANTLTAYAGVALSLRQISAKEPADRQSRISAKAAKTYRWVLDTDPDHFSTEALNQNWLWNKAAVREWEKLAQVEP